MSEPVAQAAPIDTAAEASSESVSFIFFGDAGTGDPDQFAVANAVAQWCGAHPCGFVALLGDNFYPAGVRSVRDPQWDRKFEQPYGALNLPFRPALGNHDYYGHAAAQLRYHSARWSMPARYYTYREGLAEFFVVDTERYTRREHAWLEKALAASDAPWKVVYGHHPIRSSGEHGDTPKLRSKLAPLLDAAGVAFYLCGHDHDLEVIDADGATPMVIAGGGGAGLRTLTPVSGSVYAESVLGFGYMTIDAKTATVRMIGTDGTVQFERTWPLPVAGPAR
jgi:acid phosphatase